MGARWRSNRFTELAGVELPIVLGPFGGASSTALTAAVSNAGGLGSYGLYGYEPDRILETARELRELTAMPFALNLWLPLDESPQPDTARDGTQYARALAVLKPYFDRLGITPPEPPERFLPDFEDQLEAVLAAAPAVLSVVYGVPSRDMMRRCRERGILVVGTATTVEEAVALDEAGIDAVVATGFEAGGHRVSFLAPAEESLVGTISLVPRVVDRVGVPVIAAGGIADGRGTAAALALGASAVQIGTAFLACDESAATPAHRAVLWRDRAEHTVLTRAFSGRLARGVPNEYSRRLDAEPDRAPFPAQNWLSGRIKAEAARRDDPELMSLWAGQSAPLLRYREARALVRAIAAEVDEILA